MTIRPCNEFIDCECSDNPFINTSAEAPDPNLFFARRYFPNIPSLNVDDSWYQRSTCLGVCESAISQQDADDCALRDSQLCTWNPVQPPLTLLSDDSPAVPRTNIFGNSAVSCTAPCPDGSVSTFTVPANTFYGLTQQEADALAQSVCDYRALVNRMCSSQPTVCDVTITSVMPPSFCIDAAPGDSVAMGVTFDYTGSTNPTFLWTLDGIPLTQTENPSLAISPVLPQDVGVYRLAIIVPGCPPVLSPPITLSVSDHVAVPDDFDITADQPWEEFSVDAGPGGGIDQPWTEFVSSLGFCNPTGLFQYTWPDQPDHPPGVYHWTYVSGFYQITVSSCPNPGDLEGVVYLGEIWDDNFNYDTPLPCDSFQNIVDCMSQTPFAACAGSGTGGCEPTLTDMDAFFAVFFNTPGFEYRWVHSGTSVGVGTHTNTGGDFRYILNDSQLGKDFINSPGPGFDPTWQVLQVSGLKPMPRKLAITDYNTIKSQFSDQAAVNAWNGQLNTRPTYTSTMVFWQDPPAGAFGGAVASYITNHPTSPNGKGWKLEILNAALVPIWTGLKGFGETGIGVYTRSAGTGPGCIALENNSDRIWNPDDL